MTRETQAQPGQASDRLRSIPGTFSPEELRVIRINTYRHLRQALDHKRAREMTRGLMGDYLLDPSKVPDEMRPLVSPLPSLGGRK